MTLKQVCVALLLVGCAPVVSSVDAGPGIQPEPLPFAPAGPDAAPDPSTFGPYPVGVRTMTFIDPSRVTPGHTAPRKLVTEVWYPAAESARSGQHDVYVLHDLLPDDLKETISAAALGEVETPAVRDAPVRKDGTRFPVIMFSHGKGGIRMQSTFYTVALASHGFVVVSPDHEGDTLVDLLEERVINLNTTLDSFQDRPADISFLLDQVAAFPASEPLSTVVDMQRVGMTGHSFGALTSLRVAGMDGRIKAVVAQAPAGYALVQADIRTPLEEYGMPVMLQAGDLDRTLPPDPHTTSLWEHLVAPRFMLRLKTAGHFTYSDLCVLDVEAIDAAINLDASNVLDDGCGTENMSTTTAFPTIRHYAIGLFNTYLRHSPGTGAVLTQAAGQVHGGMDVVFSADP